MPWAAESRTPGWHARYTWLADLTTSEVGIRRFKEDNERSDVIARW